MDNISKHNTMLKDIPSTISNRWAEVLSWVMVPLLMPVFGMAFIFCFSVLAYTPMSTKFWTIAIVAGINVLLPAMLFLILKMLGYIDDIGLNGRKERFIPYLITSACLLLTAWFVYWRNAPVEVVGFFVGGAVSALVNMIVNFWWKISAHAAGAAGVAALLILLAHGGLPGMDAQVWLIVWVLLCGALGSARILLERHTPLQVLAGYASGFLGVWGVHLLIS